MFLVQYRLETLPYIKNITARVFFLSLVRPVFLSRRIADFHCPACPICLSYLTSVSQLADGTG